MRGFYNRETDSEGNVNWGNSLVRVFDNEETDSERNVK